MVCLSWVQIIRNIQQAMQQEHLWTVRAHVVRVYDERPFPAICRACTMELPVHEYYRCFSFIITPVYIKRRKPRRSGGKLNSIKQK